MEIYLEELEKAVQLGNATVASEIARILAEQRSNLNLQIDGAVAANVPEKKISIKIVIEDRYTSNVNITLPLSPSMKFAEMKAMMFERFKFPTEVQKWMAGKRLAKDTDTLRSCGIRQDNDVMYLYLVSAQSVGLTREAVVDNQPIRHTYNETFLGQEEVQAVAQNLELLSTEIDSNSSRVQEVPVGWECPECTFINEPTRPGCFVCSRSRPENYVIPANYEMSENEILRMNQELQIQESTFQERELNFLQLIATEENSLIPSSDAFECPICFDEIAPGAGIVLRECLHVFCRNCLLNQVRHSDSSVVTCPFNDGRYQCQKFLQDREIKALVPADVYQKHLTLSLVEAESRSANSFHCQTPNCIGWCIYEDDVNEFMCEVCGKENCLTCKAIHEEISCKQYQSDVKLKATNDIAAKQTQDKIEALLKKGDAMKCPTCDITVMKKDGCDWIRCTMCKTEICWVTKGPRWGPQGPGDISGGCLCGINGKPCHQNCQNCH